MELMIIRHGNPDYKNDCLTEKGRDEAAKLAEFLKSTAPDLLFSSTMGRAKETMSYTEKMFSLNGKSYDWMRELEHWRLLDRRWPWKLEADFFNNRDWKNISEFLAVNIPSKYKKLQDDSDNFLRELGYLREGNRYLCVEPLHKRVAVFCHAGFGMAWVAHLLSLPLDLVLSRFKPATTSVTTIRFDGSKGGMVEPICTGLAETGHLKG